MKKDKKLEIHKLLSILTLSVGLILLLYMVFVEDEPGAVPLLLIVSGAVWYFFTRKRSQTAEA